MTTEEQLTFEVRPVTPLTDSDQLVVTRQGDLVLIRLHGNPSKLLACLSLETARRLEQALHAMEE